MNTTATTLQGDFIRLEPLSREEHLSGLQDAGSESAMFDWFAADYSTPDAMAGFVEEAVVARSEGESLPFAAVLQASGEVIGSTRFCTIRTENRSVEIGWTWITPRYQRTPANTEAKFLMLRHAFDEWGCVRVEFETAVKNTQSQQALERIGATEEGVLRKHMLIHGEPQDSIYYSVLDTEWSDVHAHFQSELLRR
jgi:RimJ/RimL family protein N-acetyltransferase